MMYMFQPCAGWVCSHKARHKDVFCFLVAVGAGILDSLIICYFLRPRPRCFFGFGGSPEGREAILWPFFVLGVWYGI